MKFYQSNKLVVILMFFKKEQFEFISSTEFVVYKQLFGKNFILGNSDMPSTGYECICERCKKLNSLQIEYVFNKQKISNKQALEDMSKDPTYSIMLEIQNRLRLTHESDLFSERDAVLYFSSSKIEDRLLANSFVHGTEQSIGTMLLDRMNKSKEFEIMIMNVASQFAMRKMFGK